MLKEFIWPKVVQGKLPFTHIKFNNFSKGMIDKINKTKAQNILRIPYL